MFSLKRTSGLQVRMTRDEIPLCRRFSWPASILRLCNPQGHQSCDSKHRSSYYSLELSKLYFLVTCGKAVFSALLRVTVNFFLSERIAFFFSNWVRRPDRRYLAYGPRISWNLSISMHLFLLSPFLHELTAQGSTEFCGPTHAIAHRLHPRNFCHYYIIT